MIDSVINIQLFADLLALGSAGILGGMVLPLIFRLVGYIVDVVKMVVL